MNREIKFRGLRTDGKGWVYGSLSVEYDGSCFISFWYSKLIEPENNYHEMTCEWNEVIPESVGQFTGLKDKNGVDIYEGDILDFDEKEWGCKFTPEVIKFENILGDWDLCGSKYDLKYYRKVIGNIHETSELI